jgi:uncharacterized damage-inducible protein DinB
MRASDILRLYDYSCWANRKLLAVIATIPDDEFTRSVSGSYGSIRNTLVHVLSAEWGWLDRCGGMPRGDRLNAEDFPSLQSVVDAWERVESAMRTFVANLHPDDINEEISFAFGGPTQSASRGDLIVHSVIHAVHHRGQIAVMLRELGHTPGNVDYLFYAAEHRDAHA